MATKIRNISINRFLPLQISLPLSRPQLAINPLFLHPKMFCKWCFAYEDTIETFETSKRRQYCTWIVSVDTVSPSQVQYAKEVFWPPFCISTVVRSTTLTLLHMKQATKVMYSDAKEKAHTFIKLIRHLYSLYPTRPLYVICLLIFASQNCDCKLASHGPWGQIDSTAIFCMAYKLVHVSSVQS